MQPQLQPQLQLELQMQRQLQAQMQPQPQAQRQTQIQMQTQAQRQDQKQFLLQQYGLKTQVKPKTKSPVKTFGLTPELKQQMTGEQAYDVYVKPRQYREGKRIPGRNKYNIKVNKRPLSYLSALGKGAKVIGKSEKASFKIVPTKGKPREVTKSINLWNEKMYQYNMKEKNIVTERNQFRINTRLEVERISHRGAAARRRGKGNIKRRKS
jgi:hypothetical protein